MGPTPGTPTADVGKLISSLSGGDHKSPLGARDAYEERTADFMDVFAPIGLLFDAEQDTSHGADHQGHPSAYAQNE